MNGLLRTITAGLLAFAAMAAHGGDGGTPLDEDGNEFQHHQRFELSREQLRERWPVLHKRDLEPFPDAQRVQLMATDLGREPPQDPQTVAEAMQDAWRAYRAEIIGRVGWMLARITYGANAADALDAFTRALELAPDMVIGYGETAMGLRKIDADRHAARIRGYTQKLKELQPLDAEDYLEKRRSLRLLGESP